MKIRRNEPCPCGSGKKFKHCCQPWEKAGQVPPLAGTPDLSLSNALQSLREAAAARRETFRELGVFILFSTGQGDAWLLEATDQDCVQAAAAGKPLEFSLDETGEVIAIDWSHTFAIRERRLVLTAYADKAVTTLAGAPVQRIRAAVRRIMKRCTPELLSQVHVS